MSIEFNLMVEIKVTFSETHDFSFQQNKEPCTFKSSTSSILTFCFHEFSKPNSSMMMRLQRPTAMEIKYPITMRGRRGLQRSSLMNFCR